MGGRALQVGGGGPHLGLGLQDSHISRGRVGFAGEPPTDCSLYAVPADATHATFGFGTLVLGAEKQRAGDPPDDSLELDRCGDFDGDGARGQFCLG